MPSRNVRFKQLLNVGGKLVGVEDDGTVWKLVSLDHDHWDKLPELGEYVRHRKKPTESDKPEAVGWWRNRGGVVIKVEPAMGSLYYTNYEIDDKSRNIKLLDPEMGPWEKIERDTEGVGEAKDANGEKVDVSEGTNLALMA